MPQEKTTSAKLPNGLLLTEELPAPQGTRLAELETLCSQIYVAAVDLGVPPQVLNQLWRVLAHGNQPQAFALEIPTTPSFVPDIRLVHRPARKHAQSPPKLPDLPPLPERKTVMAVDDDEFMLELVVMILRDENYELLTARSGDEALATLEERGASVDLLVTDYAMPGLTGRELAKEVRGRWPYLRVLYQTGFTDRLFQSGVKELELHEAFIEKPFTARGLLEAARFALFGTLAPDRKTSRTLLENGLPA